MVEKMNEILESIKTRRSVKSYKPVMPSKDAIAAVTEAGIYAASGMNRQETIIVAVTDKNLRDKLARANARVGGWKEDFDPFYGAPVILVVLAESSCANRVYDGSLVMGNMMLAAHALGLGSCWIHRAREEFELPEWKEWLASLGIKGEYEGIGHLALGCAADEYPKAPERRPNRVFYV